MAPDTTAISKMALGQEICVFSRLLPASYRGLSNFSRLADILPERHNALLESGRTFCR